MTLDVLLISPSFLTDNGHFTKALHALPGSASSASGTSRPLPWSQTCATRSMRCTSFRTCGTRRPPWSRLAPAGASVPGSIGSSALGARRRLAARMREASACRGSGEQARAFRDKELMKSRLDAAVSARRTTTARAPPPRRARPSDQVPGSSSSPMARGPRTRTSPLRGRGRRGVCRAARPRGERRGVHRG